MGRAGRIRGGSAFRIKSTGATYVATVTAALHEIEASIAIQNEGFENLIRGSKVTMEEVLSRAPGNWYIEANEAKSLGLVAGVL